MDEKKILIIEDEMIHGMFLKAVMEECGHKVIDLVSRGRDAILKALEHEPDLIISDILLKDSMTGVDVMNEVLKNKKIPFIYITALNDNRLMHQAMLTNPLRIFSKPYEISSLTDEINNLFKN